MFIHTEHQQTKCPVDCYAAYWVMCPTRCCATDCNVTAIILKNTECWSHFTCKADPWHMKPCRVFKEFIISTRQGEIFPTCSWILYCTTWHHTPENYRSQSPMSEPQTSLSACSQRNCRSPSAAWFTAKVQHVHTIRQERNTLFKKKRERDGGGETIHLNFGTKRCAHHFTQLTKCYT